jgi:hypothetical protein
VIHVEQNGSASSGIIVAMQLAGGFGRAVLIILRTGKRLAAPKQRMQSGIAPKVGPEPNTLTWCPWTAAAQPTSWPKRGFESIEELEARC